MSYFPVNVSCFSKIIVRLSPQENKPQRRIINKAIRLFCEDINCHLIKCVEFVKIDTSMLCIQKMRD